MDNSIFMSDTKERYEVQAQIKEGNSIVGYVISKENNNSELAKLVNNQEFKDLVKQGKIKSLVLDSQGRLGIDKQEIKESLNEIKLALTAVPEEVRNSPEFSEIQKVYNKLTHLTVSDLTGNYVIKKSHISLIGKGYLAGCCSGLIIANGGAYTSMMLLGRPDDIIGYNQLFTGLGRMIGASKVSMIDKNKFPTNIAAGFMELDTVLPLIKEAELKIQFNENKLDSKSGAIFDVLKSLFNVADIKGKDLTEEDVKNYMRKIAAFNKAVAPK